MEAPLASPDVSTLSGSSESSIRIDPEPDSPDDVTQPDDVIEGDSLTGDSPSSHSVSTVTSTSTVINQCVTGIDVHHSVNEQPSQGVNERHEEPPGEQSDTEPPGDDEVDQSSLTNTPLASPRHQKVNSPHSQLPQSRFHLKLTSSNQSLTNQSQPHDPDLGMGHMEVKLCRLHHDDESDSESTGTGSGHPERQPDLPPGELLDLTPQSGAGHSGSDTDSMSTPTDSPAKARLDTFKGPSYFNRTGKNKHTYLK